MMATTVAAPARVFGSGIKRREDPRLLTGTAKYTADITLPGQLYAAILRSPHGHARIRKIDTAFREGGTGRCRGLHRRRHRRGARSDPVRVACSELRP
jgi:xanthine dehydrogenase molybdopterin-binding subunit B